MKDIRGADLTCISNMGSVTSYRLFRKDGRVWVQVWTHFTARIEGLQEADQLAEVFVSYGKTLKSIVDAKLAEIDSN